MSAVDLKAKLSHLTVDEEKGTADCSVCQAGITAPESFGGIPRSTMLSSFIVQHAVHRGGRAVGLTAGGAVTKAARAAFGGDS